MVVVRSPRRGAQANWVTAYRAGPEWLPLWAADTMRRAAGREVASWTRGRSSDRQLWAGLACWVRLT